MLSFLGFMHRINAVKTVCCGVGPLETVHRSMNDTELCSSGFREHQYIEDSVV